MRADATLVSRNSKESLMKRSILFAAILAASFQAANAADLSGSWKVTGSVADNPVETTCTLTQKDKTLTGTCVSKDGKTVDATGFVKDDTVAWHYAADYNGDPITVNYNGKLGKEGTITGTIVVDPYNAEGDFTATKDTAK
jgi:hypothetical protein